MNITNFDQAMSVVVGDILEKEPSRESRRININGKVAYLKRQFSVPKRLCLESNLLLKRAHTPAVNEDIYIKQLKARGFPVMDVMAVGERRRKGFPVEGFILVNEVSGYQLDRYLMDTDDEVITDKLLTAYGKLIARLHQQGFYAPLRVKDLIITNLEECELVMIDREIRNPYPHMLSKKRAQRSLRDGFRRTRREFKKFNNGMEAIVISAYQEQMNS
ncbi:lipopolysaccharide kinase InaA family protein [uncultured Endozoicomonas sp.]|uniref:lipopolysaccharide kinase InaA family protein n=1 Tax=uncultured Endozoicomonas sp. TaxID=432652 RepID=UPI00260BFFF4|nr:lipopolysaccharide kinase InaA family protein [uncultured Endozoicomonas sp.]